jgi:hypothetical protein
MNASTTPKAMSARTMNAVSSLVTPQLAAAAQ